MSNIKNRSFIYAVMRKDIGQQDVVCCFTKSSEGAERLCDEYQQAFEDSGGNKEESYYYTVSNIFYDE
jgi:hypothetical protein